MSLARYVGQRHWHRSAERFFGYAMSSLSIPRAREDQNIWLQVGTLIDGTSDVPLSSANVVYNRAGILFVGAAEQRRQTTAFRGVNG